MRLPTLVTQPPFANAHLTLITDAGWRQSILQLRVHKFGGAMGKDMRLGRCSRLQFVGWSASLGPSTMAAGLQPLRPTVTPRVPALRQRWTPASPPWPRPYSSMLNALPPNVRGLGLTLVLRALPIASRRCGAALPPGPPLPPWTRLVLTRPAMTPPRTQPLGLPTTQCLPSLLTTVVN